MISQSAACRHSLVVQETKKKKIHVVNDLFTLSDHSFTVASKATAHLNQKKQPFNQDRLGGKVKVVQIKEHLQFPNSILLFYSITERLARIQRHSSVEKVRWRPTGRYIKSDNLSWGEVEFQPSEQQGS